MISETNLVYSLSFSDLLKCLSEVCYRHTFSFWSQSKLFEFLLHRNLWPNRNSDNKFFFNFWFIASLCSQVLKSFCLFRNQENILKFVFKVTAKRIWKLSHIRNGHFCKSIPVCLTLTNFKTFFRMLFSKKDTIGHSIDRKLI